MDDFWLMIRMMTMVVVWCTRLGWSFIAALNAGCLVPLFPPSSTFTVNKVSLSTTSRAAKRCWDTLLVEAWQVPTKKECLYNSHSQKHHTRFQVLGSKDIQRFFFPLEVDKQRLAIQSPTSKTRFPTLTASKRSAMAVTEGDEEWRKQNELLRVVEVNEIEKFESPGVICCEKDLNFVVQISSEKEQSPEEMQRCSCQPSF